MDLGRDIALHETRGGVVPMRHRGVFLAVTGLVSLILCASAWGIEPTYEGRYGNPEEPATRPYKAMLRGVRAFVHQTGKAVAEGNEKVPVVGVLEIFRGIRRGTVEFCTSTYQGMAGSLVTDPIEDFGRPNLFVEKHPVVRDLSDAATGGLILGMHSSVEHKIALGAVVGAGQRYVQCSPLGAPSEAEDASGEAVSEETSSEAKAVEDSQQEADEVEEPKIDAGGNLLKRFRK